MCGSVYFTIFWVSIGVNPSSVQTFMAFRRAAFDVDVAILLEIWTF